MAISRAKKLPDPQGVLRLPTRFGRSSGPRGNLVAYPRWTKGETAIVYHASPSLYLYNLQDGSTRQVSTNPGADYRYPHGEALPK